jgi:hypothetical protein
MSNSRNLASIGTLISTSSANNISFKSNTLYSTNTTLNVKNINVTSNSNFNVITGNVTFSNSVTFNDTVTFSNTVFTNYVESTYSNTTFGTSYTANLSSGQIHLLTLTSNTTITMPSVAAGRSFTLIINTGTGNYTISWSGVSWQDNTPPIATTASSKKDIYSFISDGTSWYGFISGQNF